MLQHPVFGNKENFLRIFGNMWSVWKKVPL